MIKTILAAAAALLITTTSAYSGTTRGSREANEWVQRNSSVYYWETLEAGVETKIELTGDCSDGQDIDLWVYDENGNSIKSTTYGCHEVLFVRPNWTGPFKIVVENINKPFDTYFRLTID